MTSFKDKNGRAWDLDIGLGDLRRLKSRLGIVLFDLDAEDKTGGDIVKDPNTGVETRGSKAAADLDRIRQSYGLLTDVLFVLVEPQALRDGVTSEEFGRAIDVESLYDAVEALDEELAVFSLPRTAKVRGREAIKRRAAMIRAKHLDPAIASMIQSIDTAHGK